MIAGVAILAAMVGTSVVRAQTAATPSIPISEDQTRSVCPADSKKFAEPCYGWKQWGPSSLWIAPARTKLAMRIVDNAVMEGWYRIVDINVVSPSEGTLRVQRRDWRSKDGILSLGHVGKRYQFALRGREVSAIVAAFEQSNFWSMPQSIQATCLDGEPVTIEAVESGKHNIVFQNVACDDSKSGIGPLDSAIWAVLSKKRLPKELK